MGEKVITRFAPSPTGALHVGGARTALFCWALAERARREGGDGRFVLRIEDTDRKRSSDEASRGILRDLAWLGLAWDEGPEFGSGEITFGGDPREVGPFHQADRLSIYDGFINRLLDSELAYPAFETPEQLGEMRAAAQAEKKSFIYRRDDGYDHAAAMNRAASEPHVVRLAMPHRSIGVVDEILGEVSFPYEELDDFVIRKVDGFPTYHLAVVVDDELMGVTDVVRGQEHLINTPRHVALMGALTHEDGSAFRVPRFAHVPTIANPDGSKMSKRDRDKVARAACKAHDDHANVSHGVDDGEFTRWLKDKKVQLEPGKLLRLAAAIGVELPEVSVADFKASGYLSGVLCNYLALLGWNSGEKDEEGKNIERFDTAWFSERFSLGRVGKSASKFDRAKLLSFNAETIQQMDAGAFACMWMGWLREFDQGFLDAFSDERVFGWVCGAAQPRARTLSDARDAVSFALVADNAIEFEEKAVNKALKKGEPSGLEHLRSFATEVLGAWEGEFVPERIDAAIKAYCESRELGMGKVAQPLRVALTGGTVSPGMGETLAILGLDAVRTRVERCLAVHG